MSTFTTTKQLEQVARGADVGVWDTPENANWALVDAALAQITTISLNNTPVILNAAQFQCSQIVFNSTLTGSVAITFPTSFTGPYMIQNVCTGSSAFTITLQTTAAGGQIVGAPFGEIFDIINDGTNIKFRNLGRVGHYEDWMVSAMPGWVTACTIPPYLNCTGTTFSSAIYPTLATMLGGNTLPDARGRTRYTLDQGTGRLSLIGGTVVGQGSGDQNFAAHTHQVSGLTDAENAAHAHDFAGAASAGLTAATLAAGTGMVTFGTLTTGNENATHAHNVNITSQSAGTGTVSNLPPLLVAGLTVVRAG